MAEMKEKILILGGTREAADLAASLVAQGKDVTTSLAGRTREPAPLVGKVRVGGFGGAQGLAAFLRLEAFTLLIDATHPFARQISANAAEAAQLSGIALERVTRAPWTSEAGDRWIEVGTIAEAVETIPPGSNVLLAIGSQHIAPFAIRDDVHYVVRMVDMPDQPLPLPDHELVLARPGQVSAERELMLEKKITHIVCRNSGGRQSYAKIEAARQLHLPVIMLVR
ncbi:MAG: cobalt-precorrin-6A reductase [Rhizobiaceae bacterium]